MGGRLLLPEREFVAFPLMMHYFKPKSTILAGKTGLIGKANSGLTPHYEKGILSSLGASASELTYRTNLQAPSGGWDEKGFLEGSRIPPR